MWKAAATALAGAIVAAAAAWGGYQYALSQVDTTWQIALNRPANLFDQHLLQSGILACADTFGQLGGELTAGARFALQSRWASQRNDSPAHIAAIVGMTLEDPNGTVAMPAAGAVFSAAGARGCAGHFVRVSVVPASCEAFAAGRPQDAHLGERLEQLTTIALATGEDVILLPAVSGCVVISMRSAA